MSPSAILFLLVTAALAGTSHDPLPEADPEITARELRHHVGFLASDELGGRAAGTEDARRAARYLARVLEAAGLEPAGDGGSFLQLVPLERYEHRSAPRLRVAYTDGTSIEAALGADFDLRLRGVARSTAQLTLRRVQGPDGLAQVARADEALFLDGNSRERREWLTGAGLAADAGDWGLYVRAGSKRLGRPAAAPRSRLALVEAQAADPCEIVSLRGALRERLIAGEIAALELLLDVERVVVEDYNVVGRIAGVGTADDPSLAAEAIVFSAHYDHLGTRASDEGEEDEDHIYNGADDDASGTAAVLELAQAFAAGEPPARTLVFLLAAGEEQGLLGTRHYLAAPAVPLAETVANLNFEMIGRPDALAGGSGKLWLTGFERTNLGQAFQAAGLGVSADQRPEQSFFQRSDNYAFALRGVVAQSFSSYDLHRDYHRVSDETDRLDFEHMLAAVRDAFAAARLVAGGTLRPQWLPGGQPDGR